MKATGVNKTGFPYVLATADLGDLAQSTDWGRFVVVPKVQTSLVVPAESAGKPLSYFLATGAGDAGFATFATPTGQRTIRGEDAEIHRFPAYVHARTLIKTGQPPQDLNQNSNVGELVEQGGYRAQLYVDFTGEGWLDIAVPKINGKVGIAAKTLPAYVLLSAPDFFPSSGQRELSQWAQTSAQVPDSLRGAIWGVTPDPLSEIRLPANLQLPDSPFSKTEVTVTAVVGTSDPQGSAAIKNLSDVDRSSTLPDDAAGVFAPGWDVSVDVLGPINTGTPHFAAYGLGSPFPEDAKLCAALSTFWPAVAPDVYRSMSRHTGNSSLTGTVAPLTDEEIGQIGDLPWDGVAGPQLIQFNGAPHWEIASFANVDYALNAAANRLSMRLLAQITAEEYQNRVLAAARAHFALAAGGDIEKTRNRTLFLSFRAVATGHPEFQDAINKTSRPLSGNIYRIETCDVGAKDDSIPSPRGVGFRLIPLKDRKLHTLFVSATDTQLLLLPTNLPQGAPAAVWKAVAAE